MENFNNGGSDHNQADERREYDDRQPKPEESAKRPYSEAPENRPHRPYNNYNRNDGYRPRQSGGGGYRRPYNYGQNGEDGPDRPRQGYQRRPYNNDRNGGEGYNGPRQNNNYRRPYNSQGGEGGYNRPYRPNNGPRRPYGNQGGEEGDNRPYRPNNNYRRPYNNDRNGEEGYDRPRQGYNNGPRRPYNNNNEGYNRPRRQFPEGGFTPSPDKKPGTKLRPRKNKQQQPKPESGIERMIKRNPQLSDKALSDNDLVHIPVKEVVRLNKFIADSGICSRREADNFISAGVVSVNGQIVTELGSKVNIFNDDVRFNGERLRGEPKVYIVMNKPKGFVTTASDPHAEKTVMDLIKGCNARVFPVGRLDKNTTGVLMFTNDGEIAEKLTHPAYDKKKIYQVTLTSELSQEDYDKIVAGVTLSDGVIASDALEYVEENDHKKIGIEIHSGKNRIVRRIFESLGYTVKGLDRVYFAGLTKKGIKRGGWRYLTEGEINILKMGAYN